MLLNQNNFLRWDDGTSPASVEGPIPSGYLRDRNRCAYKPILVSGEAMRFYINALSGLSFAPSGTDTNTLELINAVTGSVQNGNLATLNRHEFTDADGNTVRTYYAEVTIDGNVPAGDYVLQIRSAADAVLAESNILTVVASSSNYREYTSLVKFRHDRYFYGINYHELDGFYQQFRVHLNIRDRVFEQDKEVYNEVTTGKQRTFNNYLKRLVTAETYFFDDDAHDAAAVMCEHDEFYVNLKRYTAKSVYQPEYDPLSKLYKGTIELYDEEFASANRCDGYVASSVS